MRKLKLFFAALALLVGGANSASAYTTTDLTNDGWALVTDLSSLTLADNYFVFVDAQESKYSMSNAMPKGILTSVARPDFQNLEDPNSAFGQVWMIANVSDDVYTVQSISDNYFLNSNGQWWSSHVSEGQSDNSRIKFVLQEGKYKLENVQAEGTYWGPYNDNPVVALGNSGGMDFAAGCTDGNYAAIAANKSAANAPGFYIYYQSRTAYNAKRRCMAALTSEGWTQVTSTDGLGKFGYFYAFLDGSENGGESGFALTGTGGRPKYKLLKNPIDITTQLWTTEAHGSGYAIKNVSDNKYIYAIADWNMSATADISTDNTDFIATVNDGVWTLSNAINTSKFLGNYKNSPYNPTDGEDLAANKESQKGKRTFLIFSIPTIASEAVELPEGGAMAVNKWYYFDIPSMSGYDITSTTLGDIVYTTDGTILKKNESSITDNFSSTNPVALTAGRYYIKSSSANNFAYEAHTKSYSVGDVTATSIAENEYIQSLTTVTFTLGDAETNDKTATLELQGTPTAVLNDGTSDVANGALSLNSSTKVVTATFTSVTLDPSKTYTITLPADAVAWDKNTTNKNSEKVLTVKTPAVFDGHYYIKKDGEDLYFSRGGDENKQTVLDAFGVPVKITTDASNVSRVKFIDTGLLLGASGSSYMYWTDKGTGNASQINWTISKNGEKYKFYLMGMDDAKKGMNIDGSAPKSDTEANACDWELELPAAHPAKLQAQKDAQAATVATAMGFASVTTQAQMKSYLLTNFGETPVEITGTGGTTQEAWQQTAPIEDPFEYVVFAEETVNGLKPGLYRLRVYGFERIAGGQAVYDAGGAAGLAYVYATSNSVTEKVKLASLFDVQADTPWKSGNDLQFGGKYYANGTVGAQAAFDAGNYANDVYVIVVDEGSGTGSIKFGIKQPNAYYSGSSVQNNSQWICYNNFSLTYFEDKPTDGEKTDLATAISTAEGKTLGFENAEYSPYNNVAAIEALNSAKAIDVDVASANVVTAATTALTDATWTANAGDVDIVYNGNMGIADGNNPKGWTRSNNAWGQQQTGVAGASNGTAWYYNTNGSWLYGADNIYTMPLKAETIYQLSFKYRSHSSGSCNWMKSSVLNSSDEGLAVSQHPQATDTDWITITKVFKTGAAGNYTLKIEQNGNAWLTDVSIVKGSTLTEPIEITSAGYATYASDNDLDFTGVAGLKAYKATIDGSNIVFTAVTTVPAGEGVLLKGEANTYNVPVTAGVAAWDADDNHFVRGTGAAVESNDGSTYNYVLSKHNSVVGFYPASGKTVGTDKAYLSTTVNAARLGMIFEGEEATGISTANAEVKSDNAIYNLNGQRVNNPRRGLFIMNGKKVVVK